MGRPKLPNGQGVEVMFALRLKPADRDRIVAAARADGVSASRWARDAILRSLDGRDGAAPVAGVLAPTAREDVVNTSADKARDGERHANARRPARQS